jgi:hypothetical protein
MIPIKDAQKLFTDTDFWIGKHNFTDKKPYEKVRTVGNTVIRVKNDKNRINFTTNMAHSTHELTVFLYGFIDYDDLCYYVSDTINAIVGRITHEAYWESKPK